MRRALVGGLALLVVLGAAAAAGYVVGWPPQLFGTAEGPRQPAGHTKTVAAIGVPVSRPAAPVLAPLGLSDGEVSSTAVARRLRPLVSDAALGRHAGVAVFGGRRTVHVGDRGPFTPASTLKLLTTTAALAVLGPDHRFSTTVVRAGPHRVVLVGGGDPLLARVPATTSVDGYPRQASIRVLAARTAKWLRARGAARVRLGYDASLFTGPATSPHWPPDYLPDDVVSPISALWVDEGRVRAGVTQRSPDPALAAAAAFARRLERRGVSVRGVPAPTAPPAGSPVVATVRSAPLSQVVEHVLELSDNEGAEVLLRQVGLATGHAGSFAGGVRGVRHTLTRLGVDLTDARFYDGSGLSRQDRLDLDTLVQVLRLGDRGIDADLPVAGYTGSLAYRFTDPDARAGLGVVRAKTGTLTGVHGLAGVVVDRSGTPLVFAAIADRVRPIRTLDARDRLDDMAAALAACRCS